MLLSLYLARVTSCFLHGTPSLQSDMRLILKFQSTHLMGQTFSKVLSGESGFLVQRHSENRIVRALSLVNSCVQMRVCKHGCDITRIWIGYMQSDARFDWLVGNMSVYQENLFQSRSTKTQNFTSFVELFL